MILSQNTDQQLIDRLEFLAEEILATSDQDEYTSTSVFSMTPSRQSWTIGGCGDVGYLH